MSADADVIGSIPKSGTQEVRIALNEYRGHELCDVRVFAIFHGQGSEMRATNKGIVLRVDQLPTLAALINRAVDRARERGLIPLDDGAGA